MDDPTWQIHFPLGEYKDVRRALQEMEYVYAEEFNWEPYFVKVYVNPTAATMPNDFPAPDSIINPGDRIVVLAYAPSLLGLLTGATGETGATGKIGATGETGATSEIFPYNDDDLMGGVRRKRTRSRSTRRRISRSVRSKSRSCSVRRKSKSKSKTKSRQR